MAGNMDGAVKALSRVGYAARGVVFALVGVLALVAATGGGDAEGSQGALQTLLQQPFGRLILTLVALGLIAFALWRYIESIADLEDDGRDAKGLAVRLGQFVSGLTYGGLGLWAFRSAMTDRASSGSGDSAESWTQTLMAQPFGGWLAMAAGLIVIAVAVGQALKGYRRGYMKNLRSPPPWADSVMRFGIIARAVVFLIAGAALFYAGATNNPENAVGLEGALEAIQAQPFGQLLLALMGLGLIAFAVYCFIEARYRAVPRLTSRSRAARQAERVIGGLGR
jgi:hypothetical protein